MKALNYLKALLVIACLSLVFSAGAGLAAEKTEKKDQEYPKASFQLRVKSFSLQNKKDFYGTITEPRIHEKNELYPTSAAFLAHFSKHFAVGMEYDLFSTSMTGDGDMLWHTLAFVAQLRVPVNKYVVPNFTFGPTIVYTKFDEQEWWGNGYPTQAAFDAHMAQQPANVSYNDWRSQGSSGYTRQFSHDPSLGWVFGAGVDFMLNPCWAITVDARYHLADTRVYYSLYDREVARFNYSLDTFSLAIGLRVFF